MVYMLVNMCHFVVLANVISDTKYLLLLQQYLLFIISFNTINTNCNNNSIVYANENTFLTLKLKTVDAP